MPMKIFDCFLFYNELDLLEIRLNILNDYVDYFVLAEAKRSHQNKPKSLTYLNNKDKFSKFIHKIIYLEIPEELFDNHSWGNEQRSFEYLLQGIKNSNPEDIILISALDEIPSPEVIETFKESGLDMASNNQKFYLYYLNTRFNHPNYAGKHEPFFRGTTLFKRSYINESIFYKQMMNGRQGHDVKMITGGWHYSFLGDPENAVTKVNNYAHTEFRYLTQDYMANAVKNLKDPLNRKPSDAAFFSHIEDENEIPKYLLNNEKYLKYMRNKNV